jgi:hypothetical protein
MTVRTHNFSSENKLISLSTKHYTMGSYLPSSCNSNCKSSNPSHCNYKSNTYQRKAGAVSQIILLPGNGYSSATAFVSDGSAAALSKIKNLDGSLTNLVFDVHQYLDADGSGTSPDCVGDSINSAFAPLAQWLRCNDRQALVVC